MSHPQHIIAIAGCDMSHYPFFTFPLLGKYLSTRSNALNHAYAKLMDELHEYVLINNFIQYLDVMWYMNTSLVF